MVLGGQMSNEEIIILFLVTAASAVFGGWLFTIFLKFRAERGYFTGTTQKMAKDWRIYMDKFKASELGVEAKELKKWVSEAEENLEAFAAEQVNVDVAKRLGWKEDYPLVKWLQALAPIIQKNIQNPWVAAILEMFIKGNSELVNQKGKGDYYG